MKAMRKRFLAAGLGLAVVSLVASDASATRFTETAEFYLRSFNQSGTVPGTPPITAIELQAPSAGGSLYTNTITAPAVDGSVVVRTVGINKITQFSNDPNNAFVVSPLAAEDAYVIFALEGTANLISGGAASNFTSGRAIVYSRTAAGFVDSDPTTWGFDPAFANVLATYALGAPEDVVKGPNGDIVGQFPSDVIPASETNFSAINTGSNSLNQGIFLFDFEGNGPALASPEFHVNLNPTGLPGTEGLILFSNQSNPTLPTNAVDAADLVVLNDIALALLGAGNFATGLTGANGVTDWTPAIPNVGDFYNEFAFDTNPTSRAAVPEPATLVLGVLGVAGLVMRRTRHA